MKTLRIYYFIFVLAIMQAFEMKAQDFQLTQFYAAPVLLNPAFTGGNVCWRASITHRNQWVGISQAYETSVVSIDHSLLNSPIGLGLVIAKDQSGSGALRTIAVKPSFAYETRMNKNWLLRFGLQTGIGIKSIDLNKLTFGDQLYRGGGQIKSIETTPQSKTYFDASSGVILCYNNFWCGVSFNHMNHPNESVYEGRMSITPIEISFQTGTKLILNKDEHDQSRLKYFTPVIHYKSQAKFDQLDIGFYLSKNNLNLGCWYRGIPVFKSYKQGYANNDAVAFLFGIQSSKMKIGYSYDLTISKMANLVKGSHEISLSFQACNIKQRKKKYKLISCPKF